MSFDRTPRFSGRRELTFHQNTPGYAAPLQPFILARPRELTRPSLVLSEAVLVLVLVLVLSEAVLVLVLVLVLVINGSVIIPC